MKKVSLAGILLLLSSVVFVGCAHKTECGVDGCGNAYVDETYRTYQNGCDTCLNNDEIFVEGYSRGEQCSKCPQKTVAVKPPVQPKPVKEKEKTCEELMNSQKHGDVLCRNKPIVITVTGQGVAPCSGGCSPAQSYAMAKRAAIADSYRLIAEKVKGVYVEGQDLVQNMMVKRSTVRTSVYAMVRNANIVETNFKEGLCEVEMEITIAYSQFAH
jgi:hypothetical protein